MLGLSLHFEIITRKRVHVVIMLGFSLHFEIITVNREERVDDVKFVQAIFCICTSSNYNLLIILQFNTKGTTFWMRKRHFTELVFNCWSEINAVAVSRKCTFDPYLCTQLLTVLFHYMAQGGFLFRTWKMFTWDSWRITAEWHYMHLHMPWTMNFQESCISKWSFSPVTLVLIQLTVLEVKLARQVLSSVWKLNSCFIYDRSHLC